MAGRALLCRSFGSDVAKDFCRSQMAHHSDTLEGMWKDFIEMRFLAGPNHVVIPGVGVNEWTLALDPAAPPLFIRFRANF
jgi:hypothetical protein